MFFGWTFLIVLLFTSVRFTFVHNTETAVHEIVVPTAFQFDWFSDTDMGATQT